MRLHKNKDDFTEAVQAVSRGLNISPALIEKDYYVTLVLKSLNCKGNVHTRRAKGRWLQ